jgi:aryl-alcohol dehydrogenase-like predicted oxidoreductase
MKYTRLGRTGLRVSRICLGCMSYGEPALDRQSWTLGFEEAKPFYARAVEAGINFFDTADTYSWGDSEVITGKLVKEHLPRTQAVIATKLLNQTVANPGPNERGLSRKHVFDAVDASLRRLGTDYIDLWQIHRFDRATPIAETMEALHDVVKAGKVRYLGASSMYAWQFAEMNAVAREHGWTEFVSMQNLHNLAWREEERDMNQYCVAKGIGLMPWAPLAGGFLAVDWRKTGQAHSDRARSGSSVSTKTYGTPADYRVLDALITVAARVDRPMAQVALAWLLTRPGMSSPIIGATKLPQLDDAVAAVELTLSADDLKELDEAYTWNRQLGLLR